MKNVIILTDAMITGGMERQIVELLIGNKNKKNIRFFLGVLTGGGGRCEEACELVEGVVPWKQVTNPSWGIVGYLPYFFYKLLIYVKNKNIDIIHTFGCFSDLLGLTVGKTLGVPVINGSIRSARPQLMRRDKLSKYCMYRCDQVVSNSKAGLISFNVKIDPSKLHVIHNGVNLQRFSHVSSIVNEDKFTLCMVGNFTKKKDHINLVRVISLLHGKIKNLRLLLIGKGELVEACKDFTDTLGLSDRIVFITDCDNPEPYIAGSDIGILLTNTSVHGEGISNSILEYMALKKPTIATDFGGNSEVIEHGRTGYLVQQNEPEKIANYVWDLFENPLAAEKMGLRGRCKVEEQFNLNRMISAYSQLYEATIRNYKVNKG